jgi:transposase
MTMMGYREEQMELLLFNLEELIPQNHLLKKIDRMVSFDFIYAYRLLCFSTGPIIDTAKFHLEAEISREHYGFQEILW